MSDLHLVAELEFQLERRAKKVEYNDIHIYTNSYHYGSTIEFEYSLDSEGKLTGLSTFKIVLNQRSLKIISQCKNLKCLSIYFAGIKSTRWIASLPNLKTLNLSNNWIDDLRHISTLNSLTCLVVAFNLIQDVSGLISLTELEKLDTYNNLIHDIKPISYLKKLKELDLSHNQISDVSSIMTLNNLIKLYLSENQIQEISKLATLTKLENLSLRYNSITNISPLKELVNLKKLDLNTNQIQEISALRYLTNLNVLDLSNNQIASISAIFKLNKLENVSTENNLLLKLPKAVSDSGWRAVKAYYLGIEKGKGVLYEAKMILIGDGGAGKTSIAKRIVDDCNELPEVKDTTRGIDIIKWEYEYIGKDDELVRYKVYMWDFGGQLIYHSTHNFFLTDGALYLLVEDTRAGEHDYNYWCRLNETFGKDSPLLIVINEKYNRTMAVTNYNDLRGKYPNLKDKVTVDISINKNREELLKKVKYHIQSLPDIGILLPLAWTKIRHILEMDDRNYISRSDYLALCIKHGVSEDKANELLKVYNRLGICMSFSEREMLMDTIFLKPEWIIKTVYQLIDSNYLTIGKAEFTKKHVEDIWKEPEYNGMHGKLLDMLKCFNLIYEIGNSGEYIMPLFLAEEQPEYDAYPIDALKLEYHYDYFMPRGILHRFIAMMHYYIADQGLVWNTGVILNHKDSYAQTEAAEYYAQKGAVVDQKDYTTQAEILESYANKRITIRVKGILDCDFMMIIKETLDKINSDFNLNETEIYMPCYCNMCKNSDKPTQYEYTKVMRHHTHSKKIQCDMSFELIDPYTLLGLYQYKYSKTKRLKIFLASSSELENERKEFKLFIAGQNDFYESKGIRLKLYIWEDALASMDPTRLQDRYNELVKDCDIFVLLAFTKVGMYTNEEFEVAYEGFIKNRQPKYIYTYLEDGDIKISKINSDQLRSREEFVMKLKQLGHFPTDYNNIDNLLLHFKTQLDQIIRDM